MKIVSRILAPLVGAAGLPESAGRTELLMVFATRVGKKTVITGATLGEVIDGQARVSAIGQRVCERVAGYTTGDLKIIECKNEDTAKKRALDGLMAARDGDGLIIVCRDSGVYDAFNIVRSFGFSRNA